MDIEKRLLQWLEEYLDESEVGISLGDDFCYHYAEDYIEITRLIPDHIIDYRSFVKSKGLTKFLSNEAICFLHEIGHLQTIPYLSEGEVIIDRIIKLFAESESYTRFGQYIKTQIYYRLPLEIEATMWAIEFANDLDNSTAITELEEILKDI